MKMKMNLQLFGGNGASMPRAKGSGKRASTNSSKIGNSIDDVKNVDELSQYLKSKYGDNFYVDDSIKNLDFKAVQESVGGIEKVVDDLGIQSEFNGINGYTLFNSNSTLMGTDGRGFVSMNPRIYNDYSNAVSNVSGSIGNGTYNLSTVGMHEAGHLIESYLCRKLESDNLSRSIARKNGKYSKQLIKETSKITKVYAPTKYGTKNFAECFAECVAEYYNNGSKASDGSKALMNTIRKYIKG